LRSYKHQTSQISLQVQLYHHPAFTGNTFLEMQHVEHAALE